MVKKRLLCPERERRVPRQFSWVDQRLVSERQLQRCSLPAWGLYLFLVAAGDLQGLSYYSDASVCSRLCLSVEELERLRHELSAAGMIAYRHPLYQVLSLPPQAAAVDLGRNSSRGEAETVAEVLNRLAQGGKR
jgi:hypothetical protein